MLRSRGHILTVLLALLVAGCSRSGGRGTAKAGAPETTSSLSTSTVPAQAASGRLAGKTILVDPGHNGGNASDPAFINKPVWNGRESEACDTAGAATRAGYAESTFDWNVAQLLKADLESQGARVVLTRMSNTGVGPCITERAAIGNQARADAAVSIHADSGPAGGRGFAILEPVADRINDAIIEPSKRLGSALRAAFLADTGMPISTYDGVNGVQPRDDLAGLNLSTVPKVFIECGNMVNATDAALLVSPAWQQQAARALAKGLTDFLEGARSGG